MLTRNSQELVFSCSRVPRLPKDTNANDRINYTNEPRIRLKLAYLACLMRVHMHPRLIHQITSIKYILFFNIYIPFILSINYR